MYAYYNKKRDTPQARGVTLSLHVKVFCDIFNKCLKLLFHFGGAKNLYFPLESCEPREERFAYLYHSAYDISVPIRYYAATLPEPIPCDLCKLFREQQFNFPLFPCIHGKDFTAVGIDVKTSEAGVVCNLLPLHLHVVHAIYSVIRRVAVFVVIAYEIKIIARIHHAERIDLISFSAFALVAFSVQIRVKVQKGQFLLFQKRRHYRVYTVIDMLVSTLCMAFCYRIGKFFSL